MAGIIPGDVVNNTYLITKDAYLITKDICDKFDDILEDWNISQTGIQCYVYNSNSERAKQLMNILTIISKVFRIPVRFGGRTNYLHLAHIM